jgi:epoxyqueuosine reductase QueG
VQKRRADDEPSAAGHIDLVTWLESDTLVDDFDRLYVPRNDARFLRRNALVALGNVGGPEHIDVLERHADDEHARWALDRVKERA